ncbi:MAG: peptidase M23 [Bacteroidetes bacterium HGW-Bacteroidetes-15]|nr:MAG: peptidase M23 [Bacteroidetes bacterium HGW-Bacteroidetes-15]
MAKLKYKFNPLSLEYEKIEVNWKTRLKKVVFYLSYASVFSVIIVFIAFSVVDSPKEKKLKKEITQYKLQYDILNHKLDMISEVMNDLENRDDNIYRMTFEAEPVPQTVREAGFGGVNRYKYLEGNNNSELIILTFKKVDQLMRRIYVQSKSFDEIFEMAKKKEDMMRCIPAIWPTSKDKTRIVSGFGYRIHPVFKILRMHTGIDFTGRKGTPIYATGNGVVIKPSTGMSGYGLTVVIDHGYNYKSLYAHCSKIIAKPGQKVKRGDIIAYVGSSGLSVGPHCHYEIIKNGVKVNPINYIYDNMTPEEYNEAIEIASKVTQSMS